MSGDTVQRPENEALALLLEEAATLLEAQNANPFRVRAYRSAARTARDLTRDIRDIESEGGHEALVALPAIGESLARSIETWLHSGSFGLLSRLRGDEAAAEEIATLGGIGPKMAHQLVHDLGIHSLEELEHAVHDGRLAAVSGIGPSRLTSIRDQVESRLRRRQSGAERQAREASRSTRAPSVAEILDVDREYRESVDRGILPKIAPRRLNPLGEAWLPVLHTVRGDHHYTALFSNTARAHELRRCHDWVLIYLDDGRHHRQWTVVTERRGNLTGKRVVRGREPECLKVYRPRGRGPDWN